MRRSGGTPGPESATSIRTPLAAGAADHPVYRPWLSFFGGDEYDAVVERMRGDLDELVADSGADQLERLGANHVLIDDGAVADQVRAITQTAWMVRSSWSG